MNTLTKLFWLAFPMIYIQTHFGRCVLHSVDLRVKFLGKFPLNIPKQQWALMSQWNCFTNWHHNFKKKLHKWLHLFCVDRCFPCGDGTWESEGPDNSVSLWSHGGRWLHHSCQVVRRTCARITLPCADIWYPGRAWEIPHRKSTPTNNAITSLIWWFLNVKTAILILIYLLSLTFIFWYYRFKCELKRLNLIYNYKNNTFQWLLLGIAINVIMSKLGMTWMHETNIIIHH